MNIRGMRNILSGKYPIASLALLCLVYPALSADKPKSAPPAKPAAAPAKPAAKPASGGASTSHSSGPTTSSHSPTTSSSHPTTTASHPTTTGGTSTHTAAGGTSAHTTTGSGTSAHTTGGATGTHTAGGATGTHTAGGGTGTHTAGGGAGTGGKTFGTNPGSKGMPAAKGQTTVQTKNGGSVTKRADGHVATVHDPKRGMDVHRNLSGNRTVVVEHGDHSRIVAERGGRGYVQRPYMFHGHEYARRSYYYHGRYYNAYYGRYYYHGGYLNPYYPSYFYGPGYYGWAYNPWAAPIAFGWGWGGNPWFGYYGGFFTPYPLYASPSLWLTDYIIANSLQSAYQAQAAALANPAPLTPEVKDLIADEVRQQIALENAEAKNATPNAEPDPASTSIQRALTDGKPHVFVAGHDLDVVDAGGNECAVSEGDALQLTGQTGPDAQAATLAVLASKGGKECPKGDTVSVALADLQDMQNHMRETVDQGLQELQKKQGQGGLPAAPVAAQAAPVENPLAAAAPPPPPESEVASQIKQESQEADQLEKEATADTASGPGPNAAATSAAAPSVNIDKGQTIDQVTAALGPPTKQFNVGAKKIYVYKDMKITFIDGKVSDVQ
jgi:hypothetical protein